MTIPEQAKPDHEAAVEPFDYVPPRAEDIDTAATPAETVSGLGYVRKGVEESDRWH